MISARQIFIHKTLGMSHDPFALPVAEQELKTTEEIPPFFYSYFSPPPLDPPIKGKTIFQALRESNHTFIYGEPGDGKTTIRFALEADCRTVLDGTWVATYVLGEDIHSSLSAEEHWKRLTQAVAMDLFVQIVEQFNPLEIHLTSEHIQALRDIRLASGCRLQGIIQRILERPSPDSITGIGAYWHRIGKSAVRYVPSSEELLTLLRDSTPVQGSSFAALGLSGIRKEMQVANLWGLKRMFVLVDGVDTEERDPKAMLELVSPLLDNRNNPAFENVFFKFFLPKELQPLVTAHLERSGLLSDCFGTIIEWNGDALRQLVKQRFRAANSRRVGFDQLAGEGLEGRLDKLILGSAAGSPRRMLRVITNLIDHHAAVSPLEPYFTIQDWNAMRLEWVEESPPPVDVVP